MCYLGSMPVKIVGTSHIARQSVEEITSAITLHEPAVIALELDAKRFHALVSGHKGSIRLRDIKRVGFKGYIFVLIGSYIQKKLGDIVGTQPGSDMLQGIKQAKAKKIPIALIDQDMEVTLRRFSSSLTWVERWRFLTDIIRGLLLPKYEIKKYGLYKLDLHTVPPALLIKKMTQQLKKRYPNIYNVLIEERNKYMTVQLKCLAQEHPGKTILAIVGAGHKDALEHACCGL